MENTRGSEWNRWDLHLHTASSYDAKYKGNDADQLLCAALKEKYIKAVAITDHFVIDKDRIEHLRSIAPDIVFFPGVELRTDKNANNLHIILIFDCESRLSELAEDFNAIMYRQKAKAKEADETIYWDFNDIVEFANEHDALISIHAGRKVNGIDKELPNSKALPHQFAAKDEIGKKIHFFEVGQKRDIDDYKKYIWPSVGKKPIIICSDCHDPREYEQKAPLWIKSKFTFAGLKQCLYQPEERVFVGDIPPALDRICKNKQVNIDTIAVHRKTDCVYKDMKCFDFQIPLNAGLVSIIGNKGSGKSALWDCVAFDEVAGIKFKDKDGIQIMKDYMASGSFARGKEEKAATASMVFVGNINQSVDVLLKTSSLFAPFPQEMGTDTAFLDRMHCYLPGWEIPKFRPEHFTDDYGFISDYLAEFIRELRKEQYGDALDHYFRLGRNLNQRDTIAVRRMIDGYLKLMYPNGEFTKEELEEIIQIALEMRRRVKEQLKKLGGMEFYDVNFSYIDLEDMSEHYVSVPEQGGGKLIPDGMCNPGQVYTVSRGKSGMIGVFRLESQMLPGNGKIERTGLGSDSKCKESVNTAFNYLKANGNRISGSISTSTKDYIINYQDLQGIGMTDKLALPTLIALCSIALGKPVVSNLAVLGDITISGTMIKVDELANTLQVCLDSGAKKVLIPSTSFVDFASVPADLMSAFQLIPYQSAEDAVFKALGVE